MARNRIDFVRPGTAAGDVAEVSILAGRQHTRFRDGPDGTPIRETIPGIDRQITLSGYPFVYGVRAIETADGPRVVELHIDSPEHDVALTPADLRKLARHLDRLASAAAKNVDPAKPAFSKPEKPPPKRPGRRGHPESFYAEIAKVAKQAHRDRYWTGISVRSSIAAQRQVTPDVANKWLARGRVSLATSRPGTLAENPNDERTQAMTPPLKQRGERTDSSIKKLPNGKGWRARPTLGTDPVTGKQVRPTKVFATKKHAQDWVTEQRQQWSAHSWAPKSTRTLDEVADHWLTIREADPSIGPNTVRADRESLMYARRAFGAVQVQKLTPAALADWSAAMKGRDGNVLAPATKRRAIVRLKSVMAHARRMRWLAYDPSADLAAPEQKAVTATAADDIWTPEQMGKFLDHAAGHRLGGCFALTLLGLRREEVGGLRWSDLDLETGTLRIRQARVDVNGRDTIVPTKTDRSARDLPVPSRELATIKAMRSAHRRERLAVGKPLADADLLLARADGALLPVRDYSREFSAQRKAAGLKAITLGKLRHSNISRMRAAGIAADVVAAWHGHTERMTQAVYGRVTDDRLTAASAVFSSAVGQS